MEGTEMEGESKTEPSEAKERQELRFDLGTFEGFNFRDQCAIFPNHTADEVVNWDHNGQGEAEFWPAGDNDGVHLIFAGKTVTASEILNLDTLLEELGGDSDENYAKIYHAVRVLGYDLNEVKNNTVEDEAPLMFFGDNFTDLRKEAAYELFELYYPDEYRIWEKSLCDGLIFDHDRFLDSPGFGVDEVRIGGRAMLLVKPE
jgi:hypothetical protein